ncbi:MAG: matrixin family metalloprotease, partial [Planctomycetes bacterium]|nr:matrixin family metalloprotease [Planctomycetota bacterium]
MRIAGWMVLLSILAATSVTTAVDFDREISLGQTTGLELAYGAESPVVRVSQGQHNFGLMGAIFDSARDWQNATAPTGWYDAAVAKILLQVPVAACFAPGTRDEYMAGFEQYLIAGPAGSRYNLSGRWSGGQGNPRNLTWSFVPDGLSIGNGIGEGVAPSELFSRMSTLFNENEALWISLFEQSFARWEELTGLSYTRVTAGGQPWDDGASWGSPGSAGLRGDLRISMKSLGGPGGVLAYNFFPPNGDMVLDRWDNWGGASSNNWRFFRNVIMHEHGHGLGEFHVCSSDSQQMMEPFISTSFDGPRHDDFRGAQRHYGDPFEPDNDAASAMNLGTVTVEVPLTTPPLPLPNTGTNPADSALMSIDATGEQDW